MELLSVDPRTDRLWTELVRNSEASTVFHSPEWLRSISSSYGFDIRANVLCADTGAPSAGFLYAFVPGLRSGRLVSLPFSDYCDPLVVDQQQWEHLVAPLLAAQTELKIKALANPLLEGDDRFDSRQIAYRHCVDLEGDLDSVWQSFDDGAKRNIRKSIRAGVVVAPAETEEHLRSFFELHLGVRKRKYLLLSQPYRFFQNVWHEFVERGSGVLLLARHQGEVVAGTFYLEWLDRLYYKFNASSPAGLAFRPNDLLIWEGLVLAKAKGLTVLDFGLTDLHQDGLARYKRKFANREGIISTYTYRPTSAQTDDDCGLATLLGEMTRLFTQPRVPDAVTEQAGEALYKYFA